MCPVSVCNVHASPVQLWDVVPKTCCLRLEKGLTTQTHAHGLPGIVAAIPDTSHRQKWQKSQATPLTLGLELQNFRHGRP